MMTFALDDLASNGGGIVIKILVKGIVMLRRSIVWGVASAIMVMASFASNSFGQGCQHRGLRWLGQGYGPGYHWRNPGHESCYYNPYTMQNSYLISQYGPSPFINNDPTYFGRGQSGYSQYTPRQTFPHPSPQQLIGGDFVPTPTDATHDAFDSENRPKLKDQEVPDDWDSGDDRKEDGNQHGPDDESARFDWNDDWNG